MKGFRAFQLHRIVILVSVCVPTPRIKIAKRIQRTEVGSEGLDLFVTQPVSQPANLLVVPDLG